MLADALAEQAVGATTLDVARITAESDGRFKVTTTAGTVWAERAFSCTVRPQRDDRVLVAYSGDAEVFILSILERRGASQAMEIEYPHDVTFRAPHGRMDSFAANGLKYSSATKVETLTPELVQRSEKARVVSRRIDVDGDEIETRFRQARAYGERIDSVVDTVMQCARTVARKVEGIETLNVGTLVKTVRESLNIRSKHAVVSSRHDLKMDAERIHMG